MNRIPCLPQRADRAAVLRAGMTLAVLLAFAPPASALINAKFTPCDLVQQSEQILELKLAAPAADRVEATIVRALKGRNEAKTLIVGLSNPVKKEHAAEFGKHLKSRNSAEPALFFLSTNEAGNEGAEAAEPATAFLHLDGVWVVLVAQKDGTWRMTEYDNAPMRGTWQGGTDMLLRAVAYILSDPQAEVPVRDGVSFDGGRRFARLDGRVNACAAVDLANDGTTLLFAACDSGDRFFAYDAAAKDLKDVTAAHATPSRSKVFAWGDFNADGRVDLAASDGRSVAIYTENAAGKFEEGARPGGTVVTGAVVSLTSLAAGSDGRVGLLVGTESGMVVWTPAVNTGTCVVVSDGSCAREIGKASRCLVADFDGDNLPDIVQCFEKGAVLGKGKAVGQFEAPRRIALSAGGGRADAFVGDFDADGLLDIVTLSADACRLWQNRGAFGFDETLMLSGETGYKATGNAVAGMTCDFNNDGRQDFVLFYATPMAPQLYFNRGFRSFGFALQLSEDLARCLPKDPMPQQAGCIGDFNGDGAQDLVAILGNGECWWLPMAGDGALAARAVLPVKSAFAGPVTVTGWHDKMCLGAWNVTAGAGEAFVAWRESGPLSVQWQVPGASAQRKTIVLENKPVRVVLAP